MSVHTTIRPMTPTEGEVSAGPATDLPAKSADGNKTVAVVRVLRRLGRVLRGRPPEMACAHAEGWVTGPTTSAFSSALLAAT